MRRSIGWFLGVAAIVLAAAYYAPRFANFNAYRDQIEQSLNNTTNLVFKVDGDIRFTILPTPKLFITDLKASSTEPGGTVPNEFMQIEEVILDMPWTAIFNLKGHWAPKKMELKSAEIDYKPAIEHIHHMQQQQTLGRLPKLQLTHATLRNYKGGYGIKQINMLVAPGGILTPYGAEVSGGFEWNDKQYTISIKADDVRSQHTTHLTFSASSNGNSIQFSGEAQDVLKSKHFKGQAQLELHNLSNVINVVNNQQQNTVPHITAEVEVSPEAILISNVKADSDAISGMEAKLAVNLNTPMNADIEVKIDTITLAEAASQKTTSGDSAKTSEMQQEKQPAFADPIAVMETMIDSFDFELPEGMTAQAIININAIKYSAQDISGINVNASAKNEVITINNCEAVLPGNSKFKLTGNITHNKIRPQLQGNVSFISADLNTLVQWLAPGTALTAKTLGVSTNIMLMPHHLNLSNLDASVDNMSFKGGLGVYHSAKTQMSINSDIILTNIDANSFGIAKNMDDFIYQLFLSDQDKTGAAFSAATHDFNWLRVFPINWSCDLELTNLKFRDYVFDRAVLSFTIDNGQLLLSKIATDSPLIKMDGSINITLPSFRPRIDSVLHFDYLDTSFLSAFLPSFASMHDRQKASLESKVKEQYPTGDFNFFSASQYDSSTQITADTLKYGDDIFKDISATISTDDTALTLSPFKVSAFGGEIIVEGGIGVRTPISSFSLIFGLNNINPNKLFKMVTGLDKINGYMSANGKLSSNAQTWQAFYDRLSGEMKVVGSKVVWSGFSLPEIINVVDKKASLSSKLEQIDYYTNNGSTDFDLLTGSIKIENGIASLNNFSTKNSRSNGVFVGQYGIASNQLSSIAKFVFIPVGENTPLTMQIQNKGDMSKQSVTVDYDSIKKFVASRSDEVIDTGSMENILNNRR